MFLLILLFKTKQEEKEILTGDFNAFFVCTQNRQRDRQERKTKK